MEEEPSLFPDIPTKLLGIELTEHREETAAVTETNEQAGVALQARMAAENTMLGANDPIEHGPHLVEEEPDELDENEHKHSPARGYDRMIDIKDNTEGSGAPEAGFGYEGELPDHKGAYEGELLDHNDAPVDPITCGLSNQGADPETLDEWDHEPDSEEEEDVPRQSKEKQKVSSRLKGFEHNMFAMYNQDDMATEVDEYMHMMLSKDKCNQIDSCLVPVFEFIVTQYSLNTGLKKSGGKDKKQFRT